MSLLWIYIITYFLAALWIILGVGHHLFRHGAAFLEDLFPHGETATALNRILLLGYYLLNIGYAILHLSELPLIDSWTRFTNALSQSIGTLSVLLAMIHYFNLISLQLFARKFQTLK